MMAETAEPGCSIPRRFLVEGAGPLKSIAVMMYCHFSVALLCLNVAFDLFVFGVPAFILRKLGLLPDKLYLKITTAIINWTTPTVFFMPMVVSGSKLYCNDVSLLEECKSKNSLLLSNHGSRIDWMVGMFVGYSRQLASKSCERIRVGFVCEALIQFMPLIGWYRKIVANDIFVSRSFKRDAPTIESNIEEFHKADERRMLFLSPEGVVVDFGQKDVQYIYACRKFCIDQGYQPFDYILTPRYKGSACLLQQVQKCAGPVLSVCIAYVRDGELLNCRLLSPDRVVADIYTMNQGVGGSPVDIYIHLKRIDVTQARNDAKKFMMENYNEKNQLMMEWERQTLAGTNTSQAWMSQYTAINCSLLECVAYQLGHAALILFVAYNISGGLHALLQISTSLFCLVAICYTIGWVMGNSFESVPFETGIKSVVSAFQMKKSKGV